MLNRYNLEDFFQKILARRFTYSVGIVRYTNLILHKKQSIYKYIWEDFKKRKQTHQKKRHHKVSLLRLSRFISFSLKRKQNDEKYINRKLYHYARLYTFKPSNISLKKYLYIKPIRSKNLKLLRKEREKKSNTIKIKKPTKKQEKILNLDRKLKSLGQVKPIRLFVRFRNLLSKRGNLQKAELFLRRVRYIIKISSKRKSRKLKKLNIKKKKTLRLKNLKPKNNKIFFKVLASSRPAVIVKAIKKGRNNVVLTPASVSLQRSTSLGQRLLISSINKRGERSLTNRIASEFISIYKKKSNSTQAALTAIRKDIRRSYALL